MGPARTHPVLGNVGTPRYPLLLVVARRGDLGVMVSSSHAPKGMVPWGGRVRTMPNLNPTTGIAYGTIYLNDLPDWVFDEFQDHGVNLTARAAEEEYRSENPDASDADMDRFWDHYEGSEECYALERDGMKLELSYLGGAALIFVLESPSTTRARPCSPCVPGAGDLNSKDASGIECYDLIPSWYGADDAGSP